MVDAVSSALPPKQRPVLVEPPAVPPQQFQLIESVSETRVNVQRASTLLAKLGLQKSGNKLKGISKDDIPDPEEDRGAAVNITA